MELLESKKRDPNSARRLEGTPPMKSFAASCSISSSGSSSSNVFASLFASSTSSGSFQSQTAGFSNPSSEPMALCLELNQGSSIFGTTGQERRQYPLPPQPSLSATALLQKAAEMGSSASNASLLRGLGIVSSSSTPSVSREWSQQHIDSGLRLGLGIDSGSGLKELMLNTPSVFGPKHTTLDLLGLGMAASGGSNSGLSVLMNGGLDVSFDSSREFGGQDIR